MKTKKFDQRLALNKETVADLNNSQLDAVHGGDVASKLLSACCPTAHTCGNSCGGTACETVCGSEPCCTQPL
jgi:hypothetical protein